MTRDVQKSHSVGLSINECMQKEMQMGTGHFQMHTEFPDLLTTFPVTLKVNLAHSQPFLKSPVTFILNLLDYYL